MSTQPTEKITETTAEANAAEQRLITLLKVSIFIGLFLLLTGIYLHMFSDYMESLGVTGIIISAMFIAFGLIFSLPTKIYLTFLLMKREQELTEHEQAEQGLTKQDANSQ